MTISVLSKYLYHVIHEIQPCKRDDFLRIIYLVEAIDYHKRNLDSAQKLERSDSGYLRGRLTPPENWGTSLDIQNPEEIAHYWSYLVSIIEFEAFLTTIVRLSDFAFLRLNKEMLEAAVQLEKLATKEAEHLKNVRDYCNKKNKSKYKFLQNNPYNGVLECAWKDWLKDLTNLRNVVLHNMPFGGRTWSSGQVSFKGEQFSVLFLPDFQELKRKNIFDDIFNISIQEGQNFIYFSERNSKSYSDKIHIEVHSLVKKLLLV